MDEIRRTNPLTERMLWEANLIYSTTIFYIYLANKFFAEIEEAENNRFYDSFTLLTSQVNNIISKLRKQDIIMHEFLLKYKELIQNEKQEILFNYK